MKMERVKCICKEMSLLGASPSHWEHKQEMAIQPLELSLPFIV